MGQDYGCLADFEISGGERKKALLDAKKAIAAWGLAMPEGAPLALHFGLGDFYRIGEIEYLVINSEEEGYCGKFIFLFKSQRCPCHRHKLKHETFFIVKGVVEMTAGRKKFKMDEGDSFVMRPGVKHTFMALGGPALVLEVSQPSRLNDNFFEDKKIGKGGTI